MKTLSLTLAAALGFCAMSAFSQGYIEFQNNAATLVLEMDFGEAASPAALSTVSGIQLQLFYQLDPAGSLAPAAISYGLGLGNWEAIPTLATIAIVPGRFSGGRVFTGNDVAPAGNVWLEVVAWNGNAPSLSAALNSGSIFAAFSNVWSQGTGDNASIAPVAITPGFTGLLLTTYIPEPSVVTLGVFGAAALLAFRRRK